MTHLPPSSGTPALPASFSHQVADLAGLRLHYVLGGRPPGEAPLVMLVHGFPQNWWCWAKIMPALAERYTVVVPDLRGVGLSDRPGTGYTKKELAADLHGIVEAVNAGPPHLVGHDIGSMVALSYGWRYPLLSLAILDSSLPGVGDWDEVVRNPLVWHFAFHQKVGLPEALICNGREHAYISHFIYSQSQNRGAISAEDVAEYVRAYSHPGAFRAGMEMYRAFPQDAADNRAAGMLPAGLKVMGIGGEARWGHAVGGRLKAVAPQVRSETMLNCGHFLAEERPEELLRVLLDFFQSA